jgi:N4-gp56 family major capsid protein
VADTRASSGLTVEQWDDQFFKEYLTENRFSREFGTDENAIIQTKENLTKKKGDRVNFALVNKLTNDATTGSQTMEGNEEDMTSRSFEVTVNKRRNGVRVAEIEEQFSAIGLRDAGRAVLMDWSQKDTEILIIRALASKNGVRYTSSTEGQRDAWLVDNADRVLFGALRSNASSLDHSTALATCDTTNDKLNAAAVSKMKAIAESIANPRIRPTKSTAMTNGRRYYVMYAHPYAFNDLKNDTTIVAAQQYVNVEMENNRLFHGGDLLWDGVIIKNVTETNNDGTHEWDFGLVGDSSARVVGAYLVGAQAIGAAYARRWKTQTEDFDYGDKHGVEISSIYGIEKMLFGSGAADTDDLKDHGCVSGYFATSGLA